MKDEENAITEEDLMNLCESQFYEESGKTFDEIDLQTQISLGTKIYAHMSVYNCIKGMPAVLGALST